MIKQFSILFCLALITSAWQPATETHTFSGIVTDASGQALIGASIRIKNTEVNTVTDIDGTFSLEYHKPKATLIVTYTGYIPKSVKAKAGEEKGQRTVNGWRNAGLPWTYKLDKMKMYKVF